MKTTLITIMGVFISQVLFAQTRIASTVTFKSGNHSFDGYEKEAWGPHKFYIEDVLLEQGYAILYCNKRGLGNSTGNWKKNDFYGRADDAYAAVEYLKSRSDIDTSRIGISPSTPG